MATLPGMWERTITIGSAGKTFSVTGWKLGWAVGPSNLIFNCQVLLDIHAKKHATQILDHSLHPLDPTLILSKIIFPILSFV